MMYEVEDYRYTQPHHRYTINRIDEALPWNYNGRMNAYFQKPNSAYVSMALIATLICIGSQAGAYGLGDNFGRSIIIQAISIIAGYVPFVICVVLVIWLFWRGRLKASLVAVMITAIIFVAYPLLDQRNYYTTREKIMSQFVFPDRIVLEGKHVLYIGHSIYAGSGCSQSCVVLGRHGTQATLHSAHLPRAVSADFYESLTAPVDLSTLRLIKIKAVPGKYRGIEEEWLDEGAVQKFDYLILEGLNDEIESALADWYASVNLSDDVLMNARIFVEVADDRNFDLGSAKPDLFMPYHRGRFQTVPLNPLVTKFDQLNSTWEFSAKLAQLLCLDVTPEELDSCRRDL